MEGLAHPLMALSYSYCCFLQERKYPICCPNPSCEEEILLGSVSMLLQDATRELEVGGSSP